MCPSCLSKPIWHRSRPRFFALFLAALLPACQSVPPSALPALSRIDPFNMDAGGLRAAIVHARDLRIPRDSAVLNMVVTRQGGEMLLEERFVLANPDHPETAPSPADKDVTVLRIAPKDVGRFDSFQEALRELKEQRSDGRRSFSVSVNIKPCRTSDAAQDFRTTVFLKTIETGAYVVVSRGLSLSDPRTGGLPLCPVS